MTDDRPSDVLGGLPRTRPHRRSEKRAARPESPREPKKPASGKPASSKRAPARAKSAPAARAKPARAKAAPAKKRAAAGARATAAKGRPAASARKKPRLQQPAQPGGTPSPPKVRKPAPVSGGDILGTAVQAAAELAEIGLSVTTRTIRRALGRLPRP